MSKSLTYALHLRYCRYPQARGKIHLISIYLQCKQPTYQFQTMDDPIVRCYRAICIHGINSGINCGNYIGSMTFKSI